VSSRKKTKDAQSDVSINLDTTPILYSDRIGLTVNPDGVVLDVMQRIGPTDKVRIVARIGMSQVHAGKFVQELSKLLAMTHKPAQKTNKVN
jgi:hypothetical protein